MAKHINRRQFLSGSGGFTLALPLLPSLFPRKAFADSEPIHSPPRFVTMGTDHGAIWWPNMYPSEGMLTEEREYAGHTIRAGSLQPTTQGGRTVLSPVLSASSAALTETLVRKMNVIRGLDIPFYIAHHTGGHLGNFAANMGNGSDADYMQQFPRPTIDQVMAWSPSFYPRLGGIRERAMVISNVWGNGDMCWGWSDPANQTGTIQKVFHQHDALRLFNRIFVPQADEDSARPPIVDRVFDNYRRLRDSHRRLSLEDRRRLNEHMERLNELQRRVNATASCQDVEPLDEASLRAKEDFANARYNREWMKYHFQLFNDVIAAAFTCNTSRIAAMQCRYTFSDFQGDWHQDVAHRAKGADGEAQSTITNGHQRFFEDVFVDLIQKLDIEESPGTTILDNTLVMWTQESGNFTHYSTTIPVITAGSARGYFKTGQFVDYCNRDKFIPRGQVEGQGAVPGLFYNQWLGNVLESMGVPRSEFETNGDAGYGHFFIGGTETEDEYYADSVKTVMGQKLPFITS